MIWYGIVGFERPTRHIIGHFGDDFAECWIWKNEAV